MAGIWVHRRARGRRRARQAQRPRSRRSPATLGDASAARDVTGVVIGGGPGGRGRGAGRVRPARPGRHRAGDGATTPAGTIVGPAARRARRRSTIRDVDPRRGRARGPRPRRRPVGADRLGRAGQRDRRSAGPTTAPSVEMSVFGGKLIDRRARFTGGRGIVTVRPNAVTAEPAAAAGHGRDRDARPASSTLPAVPIVERVSEAEAAAASIEDARIIVAGGRGVGGAGRLQARRGARRRRSAARSARPAPRSTRAGSRTASRSARPARSSSPQLYLALGISGAIQHKVGMQTAEHDRRRQPRSRRADRRVRRPVRRRRPVRGRHGAARRSCAPGRAEPAPGDRDRDRARRSCCRSRRSSRWPRGSRSSCGGPGRIVARTREVERFRSSVARPGRPGRRSRSSGAAGRIDAVRRRQLGADTIGADDRGRDRRGRRATPTRRGRSTARRPRSAIRDDLVAELERAERALEMVEHGATIMAQVRRRGRGARGPDLDQARLPQPHPCPRGDRPPRRGAPRTLEAAPATGRRRTAGRPAREPTSLTTPCSGILGRTPQVVVVASRQESDALPPMRRAGHPRRRLARPRRFGHHPTPSRVHRLRDAVHDLRADRGRPARRRQA